MLGGTASLLQRATWVVIAMDEEIPEDVWDEFLEELDEWSELFEQSLKERMESISE